MESEHRRYFFRVKFNKIAGTQPANLLQEEEEEEEGASLLNTEASKIVKKGPTIIFSRKIRDCDIAMPAGMPIKKKSEYRVFVTFFSVFTIPYGPRYTENII